MKKGKVVVTPEQQYQLRGFSNDLLNAEIVRRRAVGKATELEDWRAQLVAQGLNTNDVAAIFDANGLVQFVMHDERDTARRPRYGSKLTLPEANNTDTMRRVSAYIPPDGLFSPYSQLMDHGVSLWIGTDVKRMLKTFPDYARLHRRESLVNHMDFGKKLVLLKYLGYRVYERDFNGQLSPEIL